MRRKGKQQFAEPCFVFIDGEPITFSLLRSRRRTLSMEFIGTDLLLRVPFATGETELFSFLSTHQKWIQKTKEKQTARQEEKKNVIPLSPGEKEDLRKQAKEWIPKRVALFSGITGISYRKVSIRFQRTRWGSCTANGDLSFNAMLMLCPEEVVDAVIVHELIHRRHMDHSPLFYADVKRVLPLYDEADRFLKDNGALILSRLSAEE